MSRSPGIADANRDEAVKCLLVAKKALAAGDHEKAERFAGKAMAMHPTERIEQFIKDVKLAKRAGSTPGAHGPGSSSTPGPSPAHGHHHTPNGHTHSQQHQHADRTPGTGGTRSTTPSMHQNTASRAHQPAAPPAQCPGTPDERKLVTSILASRDLYTTLGIDKNGSDDDIKRAYRKLALKLHPDKNRAFKADEAFKAVGKAFACLSDPDKRAYYDRTGHESSAAAAAAQQANRQGQRAGPAGIEDFDPEQLFNMFFGGLNPNARVYRTQFSTPRRQQRQPQQGSETEADAMTGMVRMLFQILPFLLIMLAAGFANFSKPSYSLSQDNQNYPAPLATSRIEAPYFVKNVMEFDKSHPRGSGARYQAERQIESLYYERMQNKCQQEKATRHRMWTWGQREEAQRYRTESCDEMERINQKLGVRIGGSYY